MKKLLFILFLIPAFAFGQTTINQNQLPVLPGKVLNGNYYNGFGDSMTIGSGATVPSTGGYAYLFNTWIGTTIHNYALGGSGIWYSVQQANLNESTGHSATTSLMAGFNDLVRNGAAALTITKISNGFLDVFANHFMDSYVQSGSGASSIAQTGSWTNTYNASTYGGKSTTGSTTTTNGATVTYTFTGDNVTLGLIGTDGTLYAYGTATVLIDGGSPAHDATINENSQTDGITDTQGNDNGRMPFVVMYTGLTQGSHTITITTTSTNIFAIDYFGSLKKPGAGTPLIYIEIPQLSAAGQAVDTRVTTLAVNTANAAIAAVYNSLPVSYPVSLVLINNFYVNTNTAVDNIHPNDIGHSQIFKAITSALANVQINRPLTNTTGIASFIYNGSGSSNVGIDFTGTYNWTGTNTFSNAGPNAAVRASASAGSASFINWFRSGFANWYMGSANNSSTLAISNESAFANPEVIINTAGLGVYGTPLHNFEVFQATTGIGTISTTASGTTVTGNATLFLNTFSIGQTITANGETRTISAIASQTSMTTDAWTNTNSSIAYTLTGGSRFQVFGNGNILVPGLTASKLVFTDASKNLTSTGFGTSSQFLKADGSVDNNVYLTSSTGLSNPMTTLGDVMYGGASGTPTRLAGQTTTGNYIFAQTGTGSGSAAPVWFNLFGTSNTFTANQVIQTTATQLNLNYDGSHTSTITTNSSGLLVLTPSGTQVTVTGALAATSTINGTAISTSSFTNNLFAGTGTGASSTTQAAYQIGGATTTYIRAGVLGTTSTTLAINAGYTGFNVGASPITTAASGTHGRIAGATVRGLGTVTSGGATVTETDALAVIGTGASIGTSNYVLRALNGLSRIDSLASLRILGTFSYNNPTAGSVGTDSLAVHTSGGQLKVISPTAYVQSPNGSVNILASTQTTLIAGTKAISVTGVTTSSHAYANYVSQGGTVVAGTLVAVCTAGTVTVTALTTANATSNLDTSVVNVFVTN